MNRILQFSVLLMLIFSVSNISAQDKRYVDPIFDDVEISDVQYAAKNYTILPWIFAGLQGVEGHTLGQPLAYQMYTPKGDSDTKRPLVIYLHTGNFFPFPQNGSCGGTIADNSNVEIATRLAKMGYVVASCDYRLGWLPTHPEEVIRRFSLINGAYRGVQDVNTFIRFFKKTVQDSGNPYGIDPDKIVVWGQGTGGYISLASAYLESYSEIFKSADPKKWVVPSAQGDIPMVIEAYNGNIGSTNDITVVDSIYNTLTKIPVGDTLSFPNHVTYANGDAISSDYHLAVNMGGALGDSTWITAGDIPVVSYHVPSDQFAPYTTDVLQVGTAKGPQPVVEVSGSYDVSRIAERLGVNDVFKGIKPENDPIGAEKGLEFSGLCTFSNTPDDTSSPWEWTDLSNPNLIAKDCNGDPDQAKTYIDSIIGFYVPRGCAALGLGCFTTSVENVQLDGSYLTVAPNPAQNFIHVSSDKADIKSVVVYGVDGKVLDQRNDVNRRNLTIERNNLPDGIYFVKVRFEEGVRTQKIMFN